MKTILCLGDSNTWGYDPRSYFGDRYPHHIRWTGQLEQDGWQVENWGHNGLAIPRNPKWITDLLKNLPSPRYMTVMLGGNDLLQSPSVTPEEVTERLGHFLSVLRSHPTLKDTTLILLAPPPLVPGAWVTEDSLIPRSKKLIDCYRALAEKYGLPFGDGSQWQVELCYDGVHFSERGHAAFAGGLKALLMDLERHTG